MTIEGALRKKLSSPEARHHYWGSPGRAVRHHRNFFTCVDALRQQDATSMSSGVGQELLPPLWAQRGGQGLLQRARGTWQQKPVAAAGQREACMSSEQGPSPASAVLGGMGLASTGRSEVGTDHCPCCPGAYMPHCCWETRGWALICHHRRYARGATPHAPYQGIMTRYI